eukprot:6601460-Prymnesium_polylepis.2
MDGWRLLPPLCAPPSATLIAPVWSRAQDENISRDSNDVGTLSMGNTGAPNSGGSQFFLNVRGRFAEHRLRMRVDMGMPARVHVRIYMCRLC